MNPQRRSLLVAHIACRLEHDEMRLNRHCEWSEAIHRAAFIEWIASSLSLLAIDGELGDRT